MVDHEQLLQAWVETVKDYAIFLLDTSGNVVSWNVGAERILGYTEHEIVGRSVAVFFTPEDLEREVPEWELGEALRVGRASDDRWHVRKDGQRFWCSGILTKSIDADGTLRGFVKAMRDLTERKNLEDELRRQAEELREADRRKNEFLAMLSHELRNPLAPILNSIYILRRQNTAAAPIIEQASATIQRQAMHMKRLVDDLLDVSRITTHKVELRKEQVELAAIVKGAVEDVASLVAQRKHSLTVSLPPGPVRLEADPTRLDQILINLLTNAAKYTEPGGSIWLSARQEGEEVVVSIRDTGIGIDPEVLPRVFELFMQVDQSLNRAQGGLGVGLTLTRSLVEMHGGSVTAHSDGQGKGSEFLVRLPALKAPGPDARIDAGETQVPNRSLTVLVAEDNPDAARSLALLLRDAGHAVHIAHEGPIAVQMLKKHRPDLIILDIGLPGMSGYEVARAIRQEDPRVPLVAMTGYAREENTGAEFDHYLVKPVNPEEVLDLLARLERSGEWRVASGEKG